MPEGQINRFEWLKATLQDKTLNPTAKATASALAVQFCCEQTGKLNPKSATLAEYLGVSLATVKRAILDLVNEGWLHRSEGRGNGNSTRYWLVTPGKIVPFRAPKPTVRAEKKRPVAEQKQPENGGSNMSLYPEKSGSDLSLHRLGNEPSYLKQSSEQEGRDLGEANSLPPQPYFKHIQRGSDLERGWNDWAKQKGFRSLDEIGVTLASEHEWCVPTLHPPSRPHSKPDEQAARYFWWLERRAGPTGAQDADGPLFAAQRIAGE